MQLKRHKQVICQHIEEITSADPVDAAEAIGLKYVTDDAPGIERCRKGDSFLYFDPNGKQICDSKKIHRIEALGIPPAWENVWICPRMCFKTLARMGVEVF